jgi:hypothetical protein
MMVKYPYNTWFKICKEHNYRKLKMKFWSQQLCVDQNIWTRHVTCRSYRLESFRCHEIQKKKIIPGRVFLKEII